MWTMMTLSRRTRVFTAPLCAQTALAGWKRTSEVGQQRKRKKVGDILFSVSFVNCALLTCNIYYVCFCLCFFYYVAWNNYIKLSVMILTIFCFLFVAWPLLFPTVCLSARRWGWWWLWDRSSGLLWGVSAGRGDHPVWHVPQSISPSVSGAWAGKSTWGQVELPTLRESPS